MFITTSKKKIIMKTIFKSLLYFSFAGLIVTGCAKNDDFSVPNIRENCEEPNIAANKSIGDFQAVVTETMTDYTADDIISGYVVSSDKGGNFYREIYFVDDKNNFSALLKADIKGSYARYDAGTQIYVKLKGAKVQKNNGMYVIGDADTRPGKERYISYLADPTYKKHLVRGCTYKTEAELAKDFTSVVTLKEATDGDKYLGKLITLTGVQFGKDSRGKTFYNTANIKNSATENIIESKDKVSKTVIFRTVEQAGGFANEKVAEKSGTMTGIMTRFQDTYQFIPRTMADLKLTEDVFTPGDGGTTEPEGPNEGKDVDGVDQNTPTFVANFSNWSSFILATNKYGVMSYAKEAKGQGKDGKGAMAIKGTPAANDYVYTIENQTVSKGAKTISMWIKGTSAKSLSFNVFKADGTYAVFNLATDAQIEGKEKPVYNKDLNLTATTRMNSSNPKNGNNDYVTGSVDAANWIKITLDLTGVDYNTTGKGSVFAFKVGSKVAYDLLVTDIVFDGGKDDGGTTGPEVPGQGLGNLVFFGSDFKNWADFDKASYDDKIKPDTTIFTKGTNNGKDGGNALIIDATPVNKNPYVFSAKNIAGKEVAKGKKKIVFYLKGKATKGMSINVYGPDEPSSPNQFGDKFSAFNLGEVTTSEITVSGNKGNSYSGSIDTQGKWVKVTLDLATMGGSYNTEAEKPILSVKVGGNAGSSWQNVLISGFTFE
jgi:hypothetical protein